MAKIPTSPASAESWDAPRFAPDSVLESCVVNNGFGSMLDDGRFSSDFEGQTVQFTGTVARLNDEENLVVFRGGGVYPRNWDVQLSRGHSTFRPDRRYRVEFRLEKIKAVPFGGYSFRGVVLHSKVQ